jgi:hypothetical protein
MNKFLLLLLLCSVLHSSTFSNCNSFDITSIRKKFYLSVDDPSLAKDFYHELNEKKKGGNSLILGYGAAMGMIMSKHAFNPYYKFKYFIEGKNELEYAISKDNNNYELRLIRFAIQTNVPSFLGYNDQIENDKRFLLNNIHTLKKNDKEDRELIDITTRYLVQSKLCTKQELELFKVD